MNMMEQYDELWPGGPGFLRDDAFPLSTDSVLLAHFAARLRAKRIFDLGCGAGALTVLLGLSHPGAGLGGIELRGEAAELCRKNLRANGLDASGILTGDFRERRSLPRAGEYDLVVANPPYFPVGSGYSAPDGERAAARDERTGGLEDVCAAAAYLCRWGGAFALVHRPERLAELMVAMHSHGLEPKRLRLVQHREGVAPNLVLLEGRRGGKPGLDVEKPLLLTQRGGGDSAEIKEIYHRE